MLIHSFKQNLIQLGYSSTTQNMLPACVKEFLNYTSKELQSIDKTDVLSYYAYIQNRPNKRRPGALSESMINHHIYALKLFFSFQMELGAINADPMSTLTFPTPNSKPREMLTQREIRELFEACESHKERAVLSLCYGLGLRRMEAGNMNVEDVNFKSALIFVRSGKNKKRRVVPMSESVSKHLKNYIKKERKTKDEKALMLNARGKRTSGNSLNNTLKRILQRTWIEKEVSLHCLRHSIATHLLENGLSVEYVRDFLGHKHLESTQIYTRVKNKQLWTLNSTYSNM